MTRAARPGTPRRATDALRGLAALVGAAVLVAGVPVALIRWIGSPLPAAVPAPSEVLDALRDTYIPDEFLLKALALVCWLVWAQLVVSFVVEVVAYARGRKAGAVPLAGGMQQAAARLVAAIALLGVLVGTRSAPGVGPAAGPGSLTAAPAAAITLVADPAAAEAPGHTTAAAPAVGAAAAGPVCEVQWRDTLWDIAERHLGDPLRWTEIFELNERRLQADGGCLTDPDRIEPGWQLVLPADAQLARAPDVQPVAAGWPAGAEGADATEVTGEVDTTGARLDDGMVLLDDDAIAGAVAPDPGVTVIPVSVEDTAPSAPASSDETPPAATPQPAVPADVTVERGDNFWSLAEEHLAETWGRAPTDAEVAEHWRMLIDQNRERLVPPGDPDLIHPGQVFTLPEPPADPASLQSLAPGDTTGALTVDPAAEDDCDDPPADIGASGGDVELGTVPTDDAGGGAGDAGAGTSSTTVVPRPGDTGDEAGTAAPVPPAGEGGGGPQTPGADSGDRPPSGTDPPATGAVGDTADPGSRVPVGLAGGGVALAGALLLLERRRRAQQRHRRSGRVVPLPPSGLRTGEGRLRWGADVAGARLVDVALRAAAAGAGATGVPPLRWVEATPDLVTLVLVSPSPAPPGFAEVPPDRWVSTATVDALDAVASHASAPAPALVPIGTTEDGTELLVDLELSRVVTVHGAEGDVLGLLRSVVVAAATSPWSEQPRIVPVGLDPDLERLPGVQSTGSLAAALDQAEEHADRTEAALRSLRCPSLAQARAVGATPEAWDPLVVVSAVPVHDPDDLRRVDALARRANTAVAVVTVPSLDGRPHGRAAVIGEHGWLQVDGVDEPVVPRHLHADDVHTLVGLLDGATSRTDEDPREAPADLAARRPPPPPPPTPESPDAAALGHGDGDREAPVAAPAPSRSRLAELMAGVEVMVRVLGEVEAVRLPVGTEPDEKLVPSRQRALEAISYLALRDSAVDREDLEISLFPAGANAAKTVYNTISSARALLGDRLFPPPEGGRYELSTAVVTDYGVFCELVAEADETDDAHVAADLLTEALGLVRGEPFTGVGRGYAWVGPHRGMIVAQVVDAAEELAEVRLATGDWRSAEWAARRGLRAFPSDERMYRLLMRTARAAGNIPGVQRVFRELCDVLADPDTGVEPEDTVHPETIELLEELTGSVDRSRGMGA